jgi:hypothetical protein
MVRDFVFPIRHPRARACTRFIAEHLPSRVVSINPPHVRFDRTIIGHRNFCRAIRSQGRWETECRATPSEPYVLINLLARLVGETWPAPVDAPLSLALQVRSVANVAHYVGLPKRSQSLDAPTAVQRFDARCVFLRCRDQITPSIGTVRVP